MRDQAPEETDLPEELELKDVDKLERTPRPFVRIGELKFPNTDALQTQRFGRR
jgi:hypothetical protein